MSQVLVPDRKRVGCPFCDRDTHHDRAGLGPLPVDSEVITDAIVHALSEGAKVLIEHGVPEDRWMELLAPIAEATGWVMAEAERLGHNRGAEAFFDRLVKAQGYGTYQFEIGPSGVTTGRMQ